MKHLIFIFSLLTLCIQSAKIYADPLSDALAGFSNALQTLGSNIKQLTTTGTSPTKPPLPPRGKTPQTQTIFQHLNNLAIINKRIQQIQPIIIPLSSGNLKILNEILSELNTELNFFVHQKNIAPENLAQAQQTIAEIKASISQQLLTLTEQPAEEEQLKTLYNYIENYMQVITKAEYINFFKNIPQSEAEFEIESSYYTAESDFLEEFLDIRYGTKTPTIPLPPEILDFWKTQINIFNKALVFFKNNKSRLESNNKWAHTEGTIRGVVRNTQQVLTSLANVVATQDQADVAMQYINDFYTSSISKIDFIDIKFYNDTINELKSELPYKPSLYTLKQIKTTLDNFDEEKLTSPLLSNDDLKLWKDQVAALNAPITFIQQNPPQEESDAYIQARNSFDSIVNKTLALFDKLKDLVTTKEQAEAVLQYIEILYTNGVAQTNYNFMLEEDYKSINDESIEEIKTELNEKIS